MTTELCNTKRQLNMDIAKCSAIIFMVLIHTLTEMGANLETGFGYFVNFVLGSFMSAPVFMTCMGIGLAYSRNHDSKITIMRGANILLIGYILNIFRTLPLLISFSFRNILQERLSLVAFYFFNGDILQFAGLALILFGILRHFKLKGTSILAVGVMLSVISNVISVFDSQSFLLNALVSLFVFSTNFGDAIGCFPLISWFIFVAFGYWFGNRLKTIKNLDKFYLRIGIPSLIICLFGVLYEFHHELNMMSGDLAYYHMILPDAILSLCYCLSCFSLLHFISKLFSPILSELCITISNALNLIYLIHWVLIACIVAAVAERHVSLATMLWIALFVFVLSCWLGAKVKKAIHDHPNKFQVSILRYL